MNESAYKVKIVPSQVLELSLPHPCIESNQEKAAVHPSAVAKDFGYLCLTQYARTSFYNLESLDVLDWVASKAMKLQSGPSSMTYRSRCDDV